MAGNFKPMFWSQYCQTNLRKALILAKWCDYQFQGEVKKGERLKIVGVVRPTIQTYVPGTRLTIENLGDNSQYLDSKNYKLQMAQLAASKAQHEASLAEEKRQFDLSMQTNQEGYPLVTDYYRGDYNEDIREFGAFDNGYQPMGISGCGKVSKYKEKNPDTGEMEVCQYEFYTETLSGKKEKKVQNVWQTPDGKLWYWEGRENKYKPLEETDVKKTSKIK